MATKDEIKEWYDKKYLEGFQNNRPYESYPFILDCMKTEKSGKFLDVACGAGFLLLAATKKGLETFGVDISEEAIKIARRVSPSSNISVGSGEDIKYDDNTFDYLSCLGALEHFIDMNKGLREMRRVAKDDATFCIMVPNSEFILWRLMGKLGTDQQDINEKLLNLKDWKSVFINNGFKIVSIYRDKWYTKFSSRNISGFIKKLTARIVWSFIPLKYDYQFAFILKK